MAYIFKGTVDVSTTDEAEEREVTVLVTDLNSFLTAGPDADIFVTDDCGNQTSVRKGDVDFKDVRPS